MAATYGSVGNNTNNKADNEYHTPRRAAPRRVWQFHKTISFHFVFVRCQEQPPDRQSPFASHVLPPPPHPFPSIGSFERMSSFPKVNRSGDTVNMNETKRFSSSSDISEDTWRCYMVGVLSVVFCTGVEIPAAVRQRLRYFSSPRVKVVEGASRHLINQCLTPVDALRILDPTIRTSKRASERRLELPLPLTSPERFGVSSAHCDVKTLLVIDSQRCKNVRRWATLSNEEGQTDERTDRRTDGRKEGRKQAEKRAGERRQQSRLVKSTILFSCDSYCAAPRHAAPWPLVFGFVQLST